MIDIPETIEIVSARNVSALGIQCTYLLHNAGFRDSSLRYKMSKPQSFVARHKVTREIVGLLLARPDTQNCKQCTYIEYLVVNPTWQRRGIGTALLSKFIEAFGILMDIRLDFFEDSLETFYKQFGFQIVGLSVERNREGPHLRSQMRMLRLLDTAVEMSEASNVEMSEASKSYESSNESSNESFGPIIDSDIHSIFAV